MTLASKPSTSSALKSICAFGQIDFINVLPITQVLQSDKPSNMNLVMDTPGNLNRRYREGQLELGAMSSHYFLEDGDFVRFPGISIAAQGPVGSVLFFSRRDPAELDGVEVGVPLASASSVQLLHILLMESYGVKARFVPVENPEQTCPEAFLLIGDRALLVDAELTGASKPSVRLDLAEWWHDRYKLPMVFGLWAARKSWLEANKEDFAQIADFLVGAYKKGLAQGFDLVLAEAAERTGLAKERLVHYYRNELDYTFTERHAEGLELYRNLCRKYDLV